MTHEDAGHYALKHPPNTVMNQEIADRVNARIVDGKIPCAVACKIAEELGVEPREVGVTVDLLEIRVSRCQLGLYGYGAKGGRMVKPAEKVAPEVDAAIRESLMNGKLSCLRSWKIADQFGLSKMEISSACEKMKIKISSCQLGSF
jgi:hypothetical protein